MSTVTKAYLTNILVNQIGLNYRESSEMVEAFFESIASALEEGEEVKLCGYGVFSLRDKEERPGRNLMTGETALVSARRIVVFHPSDGLKTAVARRPAILEKKTDKKKAKAKRTRQLEEILL